MSLADYTGLKDAVALWLAKESDTDITDNAGDFITLAETDIRTDLDAHIMETKTTAITIDDEFLSLSDISPQMTSIRRIYLTASPNRPLSRLSSEQLIIDYPSLTVGCPKAFTIEAGELQFRDIPDGSYAAMVTYRKWFDPLATTPTNNLLTNWPNIYLFSALHHAALFLEDFEGADRYMGEYQKVKVALEAAANRLAYSGGTLAVRTDVGNP